MIASCAVAITPLQAQGTGRQGGNSHASAALSMALVRLNRNPLDTEALIAAGNAALATGDTDAAVGFFTRADRIAPDNPRIEAGLASAKVRAEDPFGAIPLFNAAEKGAAAGKGGPISPDLLGDRGLAYDLIGDSGHAQQYYRLAMAAAGAGTATTAEIARRLAISLAISGDRRGSETVLSALLQKQDRAAWRARIFALAILGYEDEAVATARSTMPTDLALQIAPYLRFMRRLTSAQQAAAANLGHFPLAAQIGQDDPRVAQYARTLDHSRSPNAERSADARADRRLVPAGPALGSTAIGASPASPWAAGVASGQAGRDRDQAAALPLRPPPQRSGREASGNPAPPELTVSRETQPAVTSLLASPSPVQSPAIQAPAIRSPAIQAPAMQSPAIQARAMQTPAIRAPAIPSWPVQSLVAQPLPVQPLAVRSVPVQTPPVQPLAIPAPPAAPAPTAVTSAPPRTAQVIASAAVPPPTPRPHEADKAARPSFSEAFAAMSPVTVDIAPERGAVDLRRISPARDLPKTPAPPPSPPPPSHPSRIWVELGVGHDSDRLAFDWRRMVKDDPEIFRGKKPFVSGWARTNRLLVGPFETDRMAAAFTDRLHQAGHPSAFVWTSPAGQVVDPLLAP